MNKTELSSDVVYSYIQLLLLCCDVSWWLQCWSHLGVGALGGGWVFTQHACGAGAADVNQGIANDVDGGPTTLAALPLPQHLVHYLLVAVCVEVRVDRVQLAIREAQLATQVAPVLAHVLWQQLHALFINGSLLNCKHIIMSWWGTHQNMSKSHCIFFLQFVCCTKYFHIHTLESSLDDSFLVVRDGTWVGLEVSSGCGASLAAYVHDIAVSYL